MKKLLKRNGFTLVELIVVIAILAIMLAIAIPFFSTADARKNEVTDYARSFYSNVQELMIDEKLAHHDMPGKYTLVSAYVDENDASYDSIKVYMAYTDSEPDSIDKILSFDEPKPVDELGLDFDEFVYSLQKLLLANERTGVYIAIVDNKHRVACTYFVSALNNRENFDDIFPKDNARFTEECVMNNRFTGAWPEELAAKDKKMFKLPD